MRASERIPPVFFRFRPHGPEPQATGWPARLRWPRKWKFASKPRITRILRMEEASSGYRPTTSWTTGPASHGITRLPSRFVKFALFVVGLYPGFRLQSSQNHRSAGKLIPAARLIDRGVRLSRGLESDRDGDLTSVTEPARTIPILSILPTIYNALIFRFH